MRKPHILARYAFVLMLAGAVVCAAEATSPQRFWCDFRQAVLSDDHRKLSEYVSFPLELRSEVDDIPARPIAEDEFASTMRQVLDQPIGELKNGQLEASTLRDLIAKRVDLDGVSVTGGTFQVGALVFTKRKGEWRFVAAYLNE